MVENQTNQTNDINIDDIIFYFSLDKNLKECYVAKKNEKELYCINKESEKIEIINKSQECDLTIIGLSYYNENEKYKNILKMI